MKVYEDKIYHQIDENRDYDGDKVLVVLDKNISGLNKIHKTELFGDFPKSEIIDLTASKNNSEQKKDDFRQIFEIVLPENNKQKVKEAIWELEGIKGILSAEPSYNLEPSALVYPNDEAYYEQWALNGKNGMNASLAWSIITGSEKIRVGIIDSGIGNYPDLNDNVVPGWDFFNNNDITSDDISGHGTCVAGIIGGKGNDFGIVGVNWNVTMVLFRQQM